MAGTQASSSAVLHNSFFVLGEKNGELLKGKKDGRAGRKYKQLRVGKSQGGKKKKKEPHRSLPSLSKLSGYTYWTHTPYSFFGGLRVVCPMFKSCVQVIYVRELNRARRLGYKLHRQCKCKWKVSGAHCVCTCCICVALRIHAVYAAGMACDCGYSVLAVNRQYCM